MENNLLTIAKKYAASGLSVMSLQKGEKVPGQGWSKLTQQQATDSELQYMFRAEADIAIIMGKVSNGIEAFDFDVKYAPAGVDIFQTFTEEVEKRVPGATSKPTIEKTPSGGFHAVYRCSTIGPSKKLARQKNPKHNPSVPKDSPDYEPEVVCFIETRGEGGYIKAAPSPGYTLIQGDFENIQTITEEERIVFYEVAHAMSQYVPSEAMAKVIPSNISGDISLPGNDFQQQGDIRPILEKHGWKHIRTVGKNEQWRRPGKTDDSNAATFDGNVFFVFSSNAHPFESEKGYDKFSVLTLLEFGGNYKKAAGWLYNQGYGVENKKLRAIIYIQKNYDIRHNIVLDKFEFRPKGGSTWEYLNDRHLGTMMIDLIRNANLDMSVAAIDELVKSPELAPAFDPFKTYFGNLPAWDGKTDYIKQLADTVELTNEAEDRAFFNYSLKKWLVALVGCAINDNVVNQQMLLLTGAQGIMKSTWINKLMPHIENHKAYIINQSVNPKDKDHLAHLTKLIINCEEFESFQRDDIRALKAMITTPHMDIRLAYRRNSTHFPRRASFIANTNDAEMLADNTGARRFLIFDVKKMNALDVTPELMDKVYAQALYLFDDGFQYWFDKDENSTINARNEEHRVVTAEEELLQLYFTPSTDPKARQLKATEMLVYIEQAEKVKFNFTKFTNAIKKLGFVKKHTNQGNFYAVTQHRFVTVNTNGKAA